MRKKGKAALKIFSVAMLCAVMLSSEVLAASKAATYRSMSHFRCNNSTCGGAYLLKQPGWDGTCDYCGQTVCSYWCGICNRIYKICDGGHYCEIY